MSKMLCPECGGYLVGTGCMCANPLCDYGKGYVITDGSNDTRGVYIPQGWQCPLCRVVHAPWVQKCECAKGEPVTTTSNDSMWKYLNVDEDGVVSLKSMKKEENK